MFPWLFYCFTLNLVNLKCINQSTKLIFMILFPSGQHYSPSQSSLRNTRFNCTILQAWQSARPRWPLPGKTPFLKIFIFFKLTEDQWHTWFNSDMFGSKPFTSTSRATHSFPVSFSTTKKAGDWAWYLTCFHKHSLVQRQFRYILQWETKTGIVNYSSPFFTVTMTTIDAFSWKP